MTNTEQRSPIKPAPDHSLMGWVRSSFGGFQKNHPQESAVSADARSANELAAERTYLGTMRTLLAADRTLMAWVRTSLSMISFGFTIYKVLQGFQESGSALRHAGNPQTMGLFLTGLGTLAMVMGTAEYWWTLKALREHETFRMWRASFGIALVMSLLGVSMFFSISVKIL